MKSKYKDKKKDHGKDAANGKAANGKSPVAIGDVKAECHKVKNSDYEPELARLQIELVKLQEWIKHEGLRPPLDDQTFVPELW